jgi:hypothetical protein
MQVIKPESDNQIVFGKTKIFLAGSIEMGSAEDWQSKLEELLIEDDVTIFNPRRVDWDSSWVQRMSNPQFNYQVNWELDRLEQADIIFMYFSPDTKSPISLLELGAFKHKKMIVCCPDGFWRKGNVEIFCYKNYIPLFDHFDQATQKLFELLK